MTVLENLEVTEMKTLKQIYEEYELTSLDKLLFKRIITEWLTQKRPYPKPNGPTVQELLEELK